MQAGSWPWIVVHSSGSKDAPVTDGSQQVGGARAWGNRLHWQHSLFKTTEEKQVKLSHVDKVFCRPTGCPLILNTPQNFLSIKYSIHPNYSKCQRFSMEIVWHLEYFRCIEYFILRKFWGVTSISGHPVEVDKNQVQLSNTHRGVGVGGACLMVATTYTWTWAPM